jgi:hypothetical protein
VRQGQGLRGKAAVTDACVDSFPLDDRRNAVPVCQSSAATDLPHATSPTGAVVRLQLMNLAEVLAYDAAFLSTVTGAKLAATVTTRAL